jgi:hypothetical protein
LSLQERHAGGLHLLLRGQELRLLPRQCLCQLAGPCLLRGRCCCCSGRPSKLLLLLQEPCLHACWATHVCCCQDAAGGAAWLRHGSHAAGPAGR